MCIAEQTTVARPGDGAYASTADAGQHAATRIGRRAGRALRTTSWRRVLVALCLACVGLGLAGQAARVPLAHAAGNADAAHACQQGGYANLFGVSSSGQPISFKNEGDCVSYAAHGGQFTTPIATCAVTATTGCLTFNGVTLPSVQGTGNSITLTGATTFDETCLGGGTGSIGGLAACLYSVLPNALATGGGDYVETNSSGGVISQGIYRVADTAGSSEGLFATAFADSGGNPTACPTASIRVVFAAATLIDKNTGATQTVAVAAETSPTASIGLVGVPATDVFEGPVPSTTITC
jgi:hypothetical protein